MARSPAHLMAANPERPQGRDVIWAAIRKLRSFELLDLERETRINEETIYTYVLGLTAAGYLRTTGRARQMTSRGSHKFRKASWELARDVGIDAPRVTKSGSAHTIGVRQQNLWRCMRILKDFAVAELQQAATTEEAPVSLVGTKDYVKHLVRAGYLVITRKRSCYIGARYALVRSTGPKAPMVQRVGKAVFDPNLGKVVWPTPSEAA